MNGKKREKMEKRKTVSTVRKKRREGRMDQGRTKKSRGLNEGRRRH